MLHRFLLLLGCQRLPIVFALGARRNGQRKSMAIALEMESFSAYALLYVCVCTVHAEEWQLHPIFLECITKREVYYVRGVCACAAVDVTSHECSRGQFFGHILDRS